MVDIRTPSFSDIGSPTFELLDTVKINTIPLALFIIMASTLPYISIDHRLSSDCNLLHYLNMTVKKICEASQIVYKQGRPSPLRQ